jgi:hypothetical protein
LKLIVFSSLCDHPEFINGNVNTDFIPTHRDELFAKLTNTDQISEHMVCSAVSTLIASESKETGMQHKDTSLQNYWPNVPMSKTYEIAFANSANSSLYFRIVLQEDHNNSTEF